MYFGVFLCERGAKPPRTVFAPRPPRTGGRGAGGEGAPLVFTTNDRLILDIWDIIPSMPCNTRFKFYGDKLVEIMRTNRNIFQPDTKSHHTDKVNAAIDDFRCDVLLDDYFALDYGDDVCQYETCCNIFSDIFSNRDDNLKRSKRRAKQSVFDLCGCNTDLNLFVTLTLDKSKIDREDYNAVVKKLNVWLDNRVRRNGLKYVMVAEYHKKGGIHFHALMTAESFDLIDSGHTDKGGHVIYNLPAWTYGFTTAIKLYGQRSNTCGYITKYITKSDDKVGGRWYYSGGKLARPTYFYDVTDNEFCLPSDDDFNSYEFDVENANLHFQIYKKKEF